MANNLIDNTYFIMTQSTGALPWPSGGARIKSVVIYAIDTTARATFTIATGTPIFEFALITQGAVSVGSSTSVLSSTYAYDLGGARFQTAWTPTTLTACSAWIHFV